MRGWIGLGMVLGALLGCGSTTIVEGDDTTSSSSSGGTTAGVGGTGGSGTSSSSSSSSSGPGGAGGTGSGGDPSEGPWRADMWIGQVEHMSLRHHAMDADVCVLVTATAPSNDPTHDVDIPEPWALDMIAAWDDTDGCMEDPFTPTGDPVLADGALGVVVFDVPAMQIYPCALDVDIEASFADGPAWLPETLWLKTSMLEVSGACD